MTANTCLRRGLLGIPLLVISLSLNYLGAQQARPVRARLAGDHSGGAEQRMVICDGGKSAYEGEGLTSVRIFDDGALEVRLQAGPNSNQYQQVRLDPPADITSDRLTWHTALNGLQYTVTTVPYGAVFALKISMEQNGRIVGGQQMFFATPRAGG